MTVFEKIKKMVTTDPMTYFPSKKILKFATIIKRYIVYLKKNNDFPNTMDDVEDFINNIVDIPDNIKSKTLDLNQLKKLKEGFEVFRDNESVRLKLAVYEHDRDLDFILENIDTTIKNVEKANKNQKIPEEIKTPEDPSEGGKRSSRRKSKKSKKSKKPKKKSLKRRRTSKK